MADERWNPERLDDLQDAVRALRDLPMSVARLDVQVQGHGKVLDDLPATLQRLEDKLDARLEARRVTPAARLAAAVTVLTSVVGAVALVLSSAPS